ncbi:hypothetical protein [Neobacillus cucumis]|uniref:hypothetical protein n=1 Tax=Neobacillus cucumis TaxID=1740721 RepID=UPI00285300A5|nr:hypothetical protein [Neobacillus cucumis]MDR4947772.1 hypothetical protein [Neobacillus cucumis]
MKILTVPSAKEEIRRLQDFIHLVEDYEADSLEKWIIQLITVSEASLKKENIAKKLSYNKKGIK